MTTKTAISWTDYSSNPIKYRDRETGRTVWACVKKSAGCTSSEDVVVSRDELPRATPTIVLREGRTAPARARDVRVWLTRLSALAFWRPLNEAMVSYRWNDLKVFRAIVGLDVVQMVNLLTGQQPASDLLLGYQTVLIDVAARVSEMMTMHLQKDVTVRRDRSSAFPSGTLVAKADVSHRYIVANRVQAWQE